jgi:hypothetical protein
MHEKTKTQAKYLTLGSLLFLGSFLAALFLIDPSKTDFTGFFLFYFTTAGLVFFTGALFLNLIRKALSGEIQQRVGIALREGFFLSILVTGCLVLASLGLLSFWIALIFALSLILLEAFFLI